MSCSFPTATVEGVVESPSQSLAVAPLVDTFALHSRPNATKRIYLDFDGHVTVGTAWRSGQTFTTPAYSLDADFNSFSDAEKQAIQSVWARVAEDFIPLDVDVTTEAPSVEDLRNTGGADDSWGIRVVIGGTGDWRSGAAGVAYIDSFRWNSDTPCFVFAGQGWKSNLEFMATVISHEVGHTLGLRHDGYNGSEYYGGRGSGTTSWGPLMGNPSRPLTQWSNGDYGGSTNKQDDLAVMTTGYGFGFRPDDHGDTAAKATLATGSQFSVRGVIGGRTDIDMFGFTAAAGTLVATVKPIAAGANLDISARLLDAVGRVLATSNPLDALDAAFSLTVTAGQYFIAVDGVGKGDPKTTGYSDYGSLGQYTISVGEPTDPLPTVSVSDISVTEGNSGTTQATLTFTLSAAATDTVTVQYATANGTARTIDKDYVAATGTVTFAAGETQTTLTLTVTGDTKLEADETFTVGLTNPVGAMVAQSSVTVTITNDDSASPLPTLTVADVTVVEGNAGTTQATLTLTLSSAASDTVSVRYVTANGSATSVDRDYTPASGTVIFAPGQTQRTITVSVGGDRRIESDETFSLTLSSPFGATLARTSATVTITNDDAAQPASTVSLSGPATVVEGNSGTRTVSYTISISQAARQVTQVRCAVVPITASIGSDFRAPLGQMVIVFSPNQMTARFDVRIGGDRVVEADETLQIILSDPVGLTLGASVGITLTIMNDDPDTAAGAHMGRLAGYGAEVPGRASALRAATFLAAATDSGAGATRSRILYRGGYQPAVGFR